MRKNFRVEKDRDFTKEERIDALSLMIEQEGVIICSPPLGVSMFKMEKGVLNGEILSKIVEGYKVNVIKEHIIKYGMENFNFLPEKILGEPTLDIVKRIIEVAAIEEGKEEAELQKTLSKKRKAEREARKMAREAKNRLDRQFREQQVSKSKKGH